MASERSLGSSGRLFLGSVRSLGGLDGYLDLMEVNFSLRKVIWELKMVTWQLREVIWGLRVVTCCLREIN